MQKELLIYVGTYTEPIRFGTGKILEGKGEGIYLFKMDLSSGLLTHRMTIKDVVNPSYLALSPDTRFLYAVNELKIYEGKPSGAVSSFLVDPDTGAIAFLNKKPTGGTDPCHVCVNDAGTHIFVSNFMSGSVSVFPILKDGSLGDASFCIQHAGSSVDPRRQQGPHAHSLTLDRLNRFAFVPDLGIDKVMVYKFEESRGYLEPASVPLIKAAPGAGPRHFEFHPEGKFAYLINELASTMTAYSYDEEKGTMEELQTVPTVPKDFHGENTCADVHVAPSGGFIYGSNRGHDSIVIFAIDQRTGRLEYIGHESTRGKTPRNFAIDPTGKFLLAANQDSDTIVTFGIDPVTGILEEMSTTRVPTPVCVKPVFLK
jgi:6-phosphogluconolactonase